MDEESDVVPYAALAELRTFLRTSGSTLCASEAIVRAIKLWITNQQAAAAAGQGYQWKSLFLPAGTQLRMRCAEQLFFAGVIGDQIIFRGRPVSPRQMVCTAAGEQRNAWRDLWIRRPQDRGWAPAAQLRRAAMQEASVQQPSPTEAIRLAAKSMSEALQTALLLVDQTRMRAEQQVERRMPKHRRRDDDMASECLEN